MLKLLEVLAVIVEEWYKLHHACREGLEEDNAHLRAKCTKWDDKNLELEQEVTRLKRQLTDEKKKNEKGCVHKAKKPRAKK